MSIALDRRLFLTGSATLAGALSLPAHAGRAKGRRVVTGHWPHVQAVLDETVAKGYVPGTAAGVARGKQTTSFMVSGMQAKGSLSPITVDSLWRIYSMTKPITGMAAMLLIEDGKLKLDQNIADFIPGFANPRVQTEPDKSLASRPALRPITVRGLLTHTAGLGYSIISKGPLLAAYEDLGLGAGQSSRRPLPGQPVPKPNAPSLAAFADRLATLPLMYDPGERWSYSLSLDLLGRVIEVASGMSFEAFVQTRILDPLGMTSTFWQVPASEAHRLTSNYVATPKGVFELDPAADSVFLDKPAFAFGGSGLVSSMRDYDRFLHMLMGYGALGRTRIMDEKTARLAMSNLVHPDTIMESFVKGAGFGAGGRVTINDDAAGGGIGTFGWGGAASTIGFVNPLRRVRASGWSQIMTFGEQPFTDAFRAAVLKDL